jgi:hypothetical protein
MVGSLKQEGQVIADALDEMLSRSWGLNAGFCRNDCQLATRALAALARTEHIYKEQRCGPHAHNPSNMTGRFKRTPNPEKPAGRRL